MPVQERPDHFVHGKYGQFTRVDLVNDGRLFAFTDPFTGVAGLRSSRKK
jgi:hypothetical protein